MGVDGMPNRFSSSSILFSASLSFFSEFFFSSLYSTGKIWSCFAKCLQSWVKFSTGKTYSIRITIPEGYTSFQIADLLSNKGICTKEEFLKECKNPQLLTDLGISSSSSLEGYLYPDTYLIPLNYKSHEIVQILINHFKSIITEDYKNQIQKKGLTLNTVLTMASIIEKEVRSFGDMKLVSGVFWNRINSGRALESCASLAYILGVNKPQYTIEDTNIDSPYNTYKNPGLPPGPIANPGFNAITAAIYPDKTDYNYFLSASTGETIFSKTYDEHLRNKAKYLK